jgi:hypothetical protein
MGRAYFTALAAAGAFGLAIANRGAGSCPAGSGSEAARRAEPATGSRGSVTGTGTGARRLARRPTGLFDADESAIVIHQNPDTHQTVRRVRAYAAAQLSLAASS